MHIDSSRVMTVIAIGHWQMWNVCVKKCARPVITGRFRNCIATFPDGSEMATGASST